MEGCEIISIASRLLGRAVLSAQPLGGGRNSRVYALVCEDSTRYAAKLYFRDVSDDRDRLSVEFSALQFLLDNGVYCVPRPITKDSQYGCGIYEYVRGGKMPPEAVSRSDIDEAVQFLTVIDRLKSRAGSENLPAAAEAFFSAQGIVDNVAQRLERLSFVENASGPLRSFLADEFAPAFREIAAWSTSSIERARRSVFAELPWEERTLSPSDFGFHNALRRETRGIVFLDFEYFGWDDPAKMLADFLLHPAMKLSQELKRRFAVGIFNGFAHHPHLAARAESLYPLFGLKWCLILLNEFIPEHRLRRGFAGGGDLDAADVEAEQLCKARRMLESIKNEYGRFPYGN
jgi:phosphotransferase family enzyme